MASSLQKHDYLILLLLVERGKDVDKPLNEVVTEILPANRHDGRCKETQAIIKSFGVEKTGAEIAVRCEIQAESRMFGKRTSEPAKVVQQR